jgi:predicted ribosomally synthesized peptide with SipW-like signal peptide
VALGVLVVGAGTGTTLAYLNSSATLGSNAFTTAASFDTVAPTVSATVVAKSGDYFAGFTRQGGTYFVYANATDGGLVPSGIATIEADVSVLTAGATAINLVAGTYSVEGVSYGYRSAAQTVGNPLTAGVKSYTLTSTDNAGNVRLQTGFTTTVDNTAPTAADIQTTNGGATVGRIEQADTIIYSFSEVIDPESILAGWTGAATDVVVRFADNGNSDTFEVWNAANTSQLALGSVNTKANVVTGAATAGATGTPSRMVLDTATATVTITLGTVAGGPLNTDLGNNKMFWSPSTSAFDSAGNAMSGSTANENGANDSDF